jgi:hypothetical protein
MPEKPSIEMELRLLMREREERETARRFGRGRRRSSSRTDANTPADEASPSRPTGFEL